MMSPLEPIRNFICDVYNLLGFVDTSPTSSQSWLCVGSASQEEVLKVGGLDVGFKPFAPQVETWNWEAPPNCLTLCQGWGLWQECASAFPTHFDEGIFSFTPYVGVTQLVSSFLSQGIASHVAVHLVCYWKDIRKLSVSQSWIRISRIPF